MTEPKNEYEFHSVLIPQFLNSEIILQFDLIYQLPKLKGLLTYCQLIKSENTLEMYEGLVGLKTMLYEELLNGQLEAISQVVYNLNILKYILHIIEHNELQLIIYEAIYILEILARNTSEIVDKIIENGLIDCLFQKLSLRNHDLLIELVCGIFCHVTDISLKSRELMIKHGALKILNNYAIEKTKEQENYFSIKNLIRSITYLFWSASMLPLKDVLVSFKFFSKLIQNDFPFENLCNICESFFLFANSHPSQIQIIIDLEIMPRIIELLEVHDEALFSSNIQLLIQVLQSHQNHQEYLYGIGIIQCLGRLIKKYSQDDFTSTNVFQILYAFMVISKSKYLSQFLLNSNELDYLLSLISQNIQTIQDLILDILKNLIQSHQDSNSINSIHKEKIIMLSKLLSSRLSFREWTKKQQILCIEYFPQQQQDQKQQ